ncbi:hypothetical protein AT6N2_C0037 [Agrobacterium tumefaciens]|nr:hypothetical protein AT6N2_C0037 [Agrobacterium tumefaciens]
MREIIKQARKAAVAVRLVHGDDAALAGFPRCLQHGLDLHRVVSVIVKNLHPIGFAGERETALDAAEGCKSLLDVGFRDAETIGNGDGSGRIRHVVAARHRQDEILEGEHLAGAASADFHVEDRTRAIDADIRKPHVGLRVLAVCDDLAVFDPADQRLNLGMIEAHDAETVERYVLDKLPERGAHGIEIAVMVKMFGIDIGDDGDIGRQLQEGAVGFIRLHHHPLALTHACIGAVGIDDAAIDDGRVEIAGFQQRRDHGGRRGLAVGAANGDGVTEAHQLGQHFRTANDRQVLFPRRDEFRIALLDRSGNDHDFRITNIISGVADKYFDTLLTQTLHIGAFRLIRALHPVAEIVKHFGNAAHADPAYADEMHKAYGFRHLHAPTPSFLFLNSCTDCPEAIASTRSASTSAACGLPVALAAAAVAERRSGSASAEDMRPESFCGDRSACLMTLAPPAADSAAAFAA